MRKIALKHTKDKLDVLGESWHFLEASSHGSIQKSSISINQH